MKSVLIISNFNNITFTKDKANALSKDFDTVIHVSDKKDPPKQLSKFKNIKHKCYSFDNCLEHHVGEGDPQLQQMVETYLDSGYRWESDEGLEFILNESNGEIVLYPSWCRKINDRWQNGKVKVSLLKLSDDTYIETMFKYDGIDYIIKNLL